jgi:transcriptional repressor NrdR
MLCPKCQFLNTKVVDSRETNECKEIRRRRECEKCGYRFTTFEKYATANFTVVKRGGFRETYIREKVERGIWRALEKRNVSPDTVNEAINQLEEEWAKKGKEIPADEIGDGILRKLREIDQVAYIRFASVYKDFQDLATFEAELDKLRD